jgi:dipeptidyl aminopeptidase/acylaminoacyl peptidase
MKLFATAVSLLLAATVFCQTKVPISHDSMWLMKRVGAPAVSPDGRWVLFSVQEAAYDEKEVVNDLWITPSDNSAAPRKITAGKGGESGYCWSPDSRQIAFVAKRDGDEVAQIYLLNFKDGGEAQRFTNLSTGAGAPQFSPDGQSLLFTSQVYPGAFADSTNKKIDAERKKQKYKARVYTSFPVRYWDHWLDDKQTHLFVQPLQAGGKEKDIFTNVKLVTNEGFTLADASWANDSKTVVFSANIERNTSAFHDVATHLYKLDIAGGDASPLADDTLHSYGNATISPDGKYLYCIASAEGNYKVYNQGKLLRYDWPGMQNKTELAVGFDRPINSFQVTATGIVLSAEDEGKDKIYQIKNGSLAVEKISADVAGCYTAPSVSDDGSVIVASFETLSSPPELARINIGGNAAAVTSFNTEKLKLLDLGSVEDIWYTSKRGKKIHSILIKPAGFDASKKYPLFVLMHGGPASAWKHNWSYRWNGHLLAAPGYVLLLTNYTGSTGFGEKFAQDIQYDPFKGPGDEINGAAADAIKRFSFIDGNKQFAGGASYGGHMASWMEATTKHYKCLINHAGLVNAEVQWGSSDNIYGREVMNGGTPWQMTKTFKEQNPIRMAANFKTPMLLSVGEQDFRVPLNNTLENWSALQRMKVPSKLIVFPEENHWILKAENSRFFYQQVQEWIKKYL